MNKEMVKRLCNMLTQQLSQEGRLNPKRNLVVYLILHTTRRRSTSRIRGNWNYSEDYIL